MKTLDRRLHGCVRKDGRSGCEYLTLELRRPLAVDALSLASSFWSGAEDGTGAVLLRPASAPLFQAYAFLWR